MSKVKAMVYQNALYMYLAHALKLLTDSFKCSEYINFMQ